MPTEQSLTTTIKLSSGARSCLEKSEKGYGNSPVSQRNLIRHSIVC